MKKIIASFLILIAAVQFTHAQEDPWVFEIGFNAVDVYPVGEKAPQGGYFDEFFNWTDHWNISIPTIKVTRNLTENIAVSLRGSYNKLTKWGEFPGIPSVPVDNLKYYGLDVMGNYNFLPESKFQPFIAVGGGYTWIQEGAFNTYSNANGTNNIVGSGTVNGGVGLKFWPTEKIGFSIESTYKHSFNEYLTKHFLHSFGITFRLGKSIGDASDNEVIEEKVTEVISLNDSDNDGIPNDYDLCPDVAGPKQFGGCPDSDGDGIPDNLDPCPNEKGTNGNGCPTATNTNSNVNALASSSAIKAANTVVYFKTNSAELDNNAKVILNQLATAITSSNSLKIEIDGNTDNVGGTAYNENLSIQRANSVKTYLISKGVSENAIRTMGLGETKPAATNNTTDGKALNRRAEVNINIIQ